MSGQLRMSVADFNARQLRKQPRVRNVKKKVIDGIEFHSTGEAIRYQDLKLQQHAGQITGLCRQVPFAVFINNIEVCVWIADFVYFVKGERVVEDRKGGYKTDIYRLKRKLVEAYYGFRIFET